LRFFSPDELIRLFGFADIDKSFSSTYVSTSSLIDQEKKDIIKKSFFPEHISKRKCYELIGNSLNVIVVSHLLQFLFESEFNLKNDK
jgi:hypothetical protein